MKARTLAASMIFLCLGSIGVIAQDESGDKNPVETRQQLMKGIGGSMGALGAIAKGEKPYEAETVRIALTTIETNIDDFPDFFPAGTEAGAVAKSEARPEIWQNIEDFHAKAAKLESDAEALLAALPADQAGVQQAMRALGGNCQSCHESYRVKK